MLFINYYTCISCNFRPPSEYSTCEGGNFARASIPLQGTLLSLTVESVGTDKVDSPLIAILTSDYTIRLWRSNPIRAGEADLVALESTLKLEIRRDIFNSTKEQLAKPPQTATQLGIPPVHLNLDIAALPSELRQLESNHGNNAIVVSDSMTITDEIPSPHLNEFLNAKPAPFEIPEEEPPLQNHESETVAGAELSTSLEAIVGFEETKADFGAQNAADFFALNIAEENGQTEDQAGQLSGKSSPFQLPVILNSKQSVFCFMKESMILQDCPLTFVVSFCAQSICKVAVHTPTDFDFICRQKFIEADLLQFKSAESTGATSRHTDGLASLPPSFFGLPDTTKNNIEASSLPSKDTLYGQRYVVQSRGSKKSDSTRNSFSDTVSYSVTQSLRSLISSIDVSDNNIPSISGHDSASFSLGGEEAVLLTGASKSQLVVKTPVRKPLAGKKKVGRKPPTSTKLDAKQMTEIEVASHSLDTQEEMIEVSQMDSSIDHPLEIIQSMELSTRSHHSDASNAGITFETIDEINHNLHKSRNSSLFSDQGGTEVLKEDKIDFSSTRDLIITDAKEAPQETGLFAVDGKGKKGRSASAKVAYFCPLHLLSSSDITTLPSGQHHLSTLQFILPLGMLIRNSIGKLPPGGTTRNKSLAISSLPSDSQMQLFTRSGLLNVSALEGNADAKTLNLLDIKWISIAYRSCSMAVMTVLKETYVFALDKSVTQIAPSRVEFALSPGCTATCMLLSDVFVKPPPKNVNLSELEMNSTRKGNGNNKSKAYKSALNAANNAATSTNDNSTLGGTLGLYTLLMVGDTEGVLHFSILANHSSSTNNNSSSPSGSVVVSFGKLKAHSSPVLQALCTGDPVRSLWRIGSEIDVTHNQVRI